MDSFKTSTFGPASCAWKLQLHTQNSQISAHICPVFSEFEISLGNDWNRVISTFTLKLCNPLTQAVISSKSLTGSYFLDNMNIKAGWDGFFDYNELRSLNLESFKILAKVTWDPAALSEYTNLGKAKGALSNAIKSNQSFRRTIDGLQNDNNNLMAMNSELNSNVQKLQSELQHILDARHTASRDAEISKETLKTVSAELEKARSVQNDYYASQVKLANVKERLSQVRCAMEDGTEISITAEQEQEINYHQEYLSVFHQKAEIEQKLAQCNAQLHLVSNSMQDVSIQNQMELLNKDHQILLPSDKLINAVEAAKNEIKVGKATMDELKKRLPMMKSLAERSGFFGEVSMIQCGLDIAVASMYDVEELDIETTPEFSKIKKELESVRKELMVCRISAENTDLADMFSLAGSPQILESAESTTKLAPPTHSYYSKKATPDSSNEQIALLSGKIESMESRIVDLLKKRSISANSQVNLVGGPPLDEFETWTPAGTSDSQLKTEELNVVCILIRLF